MLRRFEIYTMAEGVPPEKVHELEEAFRRCGEFIPEMKHSVVGNNLSDIDVQMVWEHGYESPEAYQRYMVHPFHANILDRYLLNDCPERIVGNSPLGDGTLVGYTCDGPTYLMHDGMRKVVLFGLEGPEEQQKSFIEELRALAGSEARRALVRRRTEHVRGGLVRRCDADASPLPVDARVGAGVRVRRGL